MSKPNSLRLVFAGTPDFAAAHLAALLDAGHVPVAVYTQPDRPAGRGKKLSASPVKQLAQTASIPVLQPASLKNEAALAELAELEADLLIVVAYGLILPQAVLDTPRYGCINVHASLLPRWRGAAPIQRAIEAGDPNTGVTIMQMDAGLDTGAMLAKAELPIGINNTAQDLHDELAGVGAPLLIKVIEELPNYQAQSVPQPDQGSTYAAKIEKSEAEVQWQRPAVELQRLVRAFVPFPVCWTMIDDQRLKIWEAEATRESGTPGEIMAADDFGLLIGCGEGSLRVTRLQLPGGKPLASSELLRSRRELFAPGRQVGG
ncbi:MAG: methionyl-tRNA formyltransferase [Halieaceae bacterium]